MASREEDIPAKPAEATKFVEDMDESQVQSTLEMHVGLQSLGSPCDMNATVQYPKKVPRAADRSTSPATTLSSLEPSNLSGENYGGVTQPDMIRSTDFELLRQGFLTPERLEKMKEDVSTEMMCPEIILLPSFSVFSLSLSLSLSLLRSPWRSSVSIGRMNKARTGHSQLRAGAPNRR